MLLEQQTEEKLLQLWCVFCAVTKVGDESALLGNVDVALLCD